MTRESFAGSASGLVAICLWSTTVAFARSLTEQLGPLTAAAVVYAVGGGLCAVRLLSSNRRLNQIRTLPRKYLFGCGALFVAYMLVLFLAVGLARNREQVLEVGLLNYLWPALTILFSLFLLNKKAHFVLIPGTLLALAGVFLVVTEGANLSWRSLTRNVSDNPAAYSLGLAAAVSWALYSNLTRRWAGGKRVGAVELFLPVTGALLCAVALVAREPSDWSLRAGLEAGALGVFTWLAYGLWDVAMRRGDVVLVVACSYLTPFLSTVVTCVYLDVAADVSLWIGCALIVAGSLISWASISTRKRLSASSSSR